MNYVKKVVIGDATLYQGDCALILPTLGKVDAVITDPPYGIGYTVYHKGAKEFGQIIGDDAEFDPTHLLRLRADLLILWGANNFAKQLPRGGWLCWDKRTNEAADKILGSPFELAWVNDPKRYRIARIMHGGAKNADGEGIEREHPTQKPIRLMAWCVEQCKAKTIVDPYMGSGTTGVACMQTGRGFIGIERDPAYFATACRRIEQAHAQGQLFAPEQKKQEQEALL